MSLTPIQGNRPLEVVHYHRKPYGSYFSIERVFGAIRHELPGDIACRVFVCRYVSRGFFGRLWNVVEAALHRGQINHITGDVHFLAMLLPKRRTILTIHDCGLLRRERGIRLFIYKLVWYQLPMLRSSVVVAISEWTRRELQELLPAFAAKVVVIPDPLVRGFTASSREFNDEDPVILHIGTGANKNLERVAEALAGVQCRMDIIGDLSEEQKSALARSGIRYTNSSRLTDAEIVQRYRAADLVEFCSTYEGFGMPIAEANAIGRAVVTSNIEPMTSVASSAACLVDPYDISSIRAGVIKVIEDRGYREDMVRRGFENAKRFSAATIAEAYANCYRDLALAADQRR
jgi:glycosyltransferase involved in cell wall biosynthesis